MLKLRMPKLPSPAFHLHFKVLLGYKSHKKFACLHRSFFELRKGIVNKYVLIEVEFCPNLAFFVLSPLAAFLCWAASAFDPLARKKLSGIPLSGQPVSVRNYITYNIEAVRNNFINKSMKSLYNLTTHLEKNNVPVT